LPNRWDSGFLDDIEFRRHVFPVAVSESNPFGWSGKVFISGKHFFGVHIMMAGEPFQKTRYYTFSCPRFLAEISDQATVAPNLAQIVTGASINLIAFREVAKLLSVKVEQIVREAIPHIPPAPVPKNPDIRHFVLFLPYSYRLSIPVRRPAEDMQLRADVI
jgi:hypothetical protein